MADRLGSNNSPMADFANTLADSDRINPIVSLITNLTKFRTNFNDEPLAFSVVMNMLETLFLNRFMPRLVRLLSVVGVSLAVVAGSATATYADEEDFEVQLRPDPTGLCVLPELGGMWVNDSTGQIVQLEDLCEALLPERFIGVSTTELSELEIAFWEAFLEVASREAITFANQVDHQDVVDYGKSVCLSLEQGDTMTDVRKVQIEGGLPPAFDAAVNVAAINTYCPGYQYQIGR